MTEAVVQFYSSCVPVSPDFLFFSKNVLFALKISSRCPTSSDCIKFAVLGRTATLQGVSLSIPMVPQTFLKPLLLIRFILCRQEGENVCQDKQTENDMCPFASPFPVLHCKTSKFIYRFQILSGKVKV